jgi:hypothetical protein
MHRPSTVGAKSGAEDARSPNAARPLDAAGPREAFGLIRYPELITGAGSGLGKPLRPRW